VELAADAWRPMETPPGVTAPEVVYIVDGVRRIDARIWIDTDEQTYPGWLPRTRPGWCAATRGRAWPSC